MTRRPSRPEALAVHRRLRAALMLIVVGGLSVLGCGRPAPLPTDYGRASGQGMQSINGLSVLAHLFSQAGFDVSTWRRLSPKLDREEVLVWAPQHRVSITATEAGFLDRWLSRPGRTLIFIGGGYDGRADYWRDVLPLVGNAQRADVRNEIAHAEADRYLTQNRTYYPTTSGCDWFEIIPFVSGSPTRDVAGEWATELNVRATQFADRQVLKLPQPSTEGEAVLFGESLLSVNGQPLVGRVTRNTWPESQVLVIADGSWLLNSRLVNREHRQLAQTMIGACGLPKRVCFLESGDQELSVSDTDTSPPMMLQFFTIYPINVLMLHVVFLGILYCCSVYPIFGQPKELPTDVVSDFGKHVTAVGELLEKGRDRDYAQSVVDQLRDLN